MKFKTKPVVKEAVQWTGKNLDEILRFTGANEIGNDFRREDWIIIPTLEGNMKAIPGDWIIKGLRNEFYPCKPDIFEKTYEPVEE